MSKGIKNLGLIEIIIIVPIITATTYLKFFINF